MARIKEERTKATHSVKASAQANTVVPRRNPNGRFKPKSVAFANLPTAASSNRKIHQENQQNYIRDFPSIMHLINEYPHIKQLLDEMAADKDHPVEMFSTHFLSAMLIPEGESLQGVPFVVVTDSWRQEWERGVQVPTNVHSIPQPRYVHLDRPRCLVSCKRPCTSTRESFHLPSKRYLCATDCGLLPTDCNSTNSAEPELPLYDADRLDLSWLNAFNASRKRGPMQLTITVFEFLIDSFESAVNERLRAAVMQQESFFRVQFDQSVACDVCRSPTAADAHGNAMVFCDACNICVHQLCYGVCRLPAEEESWLCAPCARGIVAPSCALCGYAGGALKTLDHSLLASDSNSCDSTLSSIYSEGANIEWAHLSCALWLSEYSVADADKMEPIIAIGQVPALKRYLKCGLCDRPNGLCLTCYRASCEEAFHVTCAMAQGLRFRTVWRAAPDNSVQQVAFCRKHSQPPIGFYSPPRCAVVESVAADSPNKTSASSNPSRLPRNARPYVNVKRSVLARIYQSPSKSPSCSSSNTSSRSPTPNGQVGLRPERVIPQATVVKCYRELEERVLLIRERFERAARSVMDSRALDRLAKRFDVQLPAVRSVYAYWLLKRRANRCKPLKRPIPFMPVQLDATQSPTGLSPRSPDTLLRPIGTALPGSSNFVVMNSQTKRNVGLNKIVAHAHTFIGLRRNLERLRNLTYLVIRRERLRRAVVHVQSDIINVQIGNIQKLGTSHDAASDNSDLHKLLTDAHAGKSLYENYEVLASLTASYEQLCERQRLGHSELATATRIDSESYEHESKESDTRRKRPTEVNTKKIKVTRVKANRGSKPRRDPPAETESQSPAVCRSYSIETENSSESRKQNANESKRSHAEMERDADKENHKTDRTIAPFRKGPTLGECPSAFTLASPNRRRAALRSRNGSSNGTLTKCAPVRLRTNGNVSGQRDSSQSNATRKVALKKLKISLKVNTRNMQLRPRNGLILRLRLPAK